MPQFRPPAVALAVVALFSTSIFAIECKVTILPFDIDGSQLEIRKVQFTGVSDKRVIAENSQITNVVPCGELLDIEMHTYNNHTELDHFITKRVRAEFSETSITVAPSINTIPGRGSRGFAIARHGDGPNLSVKVVKVDGQNVDWIIAKSIFRDQSSSCRPSEDGYCRLRGLSAGWLNVFIFKGGKLWVSSLIELVEYSGLAEVGNNGLVAGTNVRVHSNFQVK